MKVVRLVKNSDFKSVEHLVKHSGKGMTTMPKTPKEIKERIAWSEKSRNKKTKKPNQDSYLFVLEDNGRIVGLSAIYTSVSLKKPSVFFKRSISQLKSKSLNFTKDLDVLSLHLCKQPYSELGTLFLKPAFRGKGRGSLLSFSRFIFMSAHPQRFDPKLFVEIRGFKNAKDESYFWNSFSKTFFNLDFFKADEISYIDNHFIMESIPKYPFIIEHMPKKVQRVIGKPHPNAINLTPKRLGIRTRPARPRMKGLQSEADVMTACKTTWRSLKHRNGEQHLCTFCRPIQITSPTTYRRSQACGVCATGCQEIALSA